MLTTQSPSLFAIAILGAFSCSSGAATPQDPFLSHSDVVFMYRADAETYQAYGATHLAWGPAPKPEYLSAAASVTYLGSVGMVTEFNRFFERFPERYNEALCLDIDDRNVKVPWLIDHQHKGIPYWVCCTRQPLFRQYIRERVMETLKAGANGIHIDDHLGTAAFTWKGVCFCDQCEPAFHEYLQALPAEELQGAGIVALIDYDFQADLRSWRESGRTLQDHPLWYHWETFHCRNTVDFMQELKSLAAETTGRYVPFGANAGLLWTKHLADYQALDLFSSETEHEANLRRPSDLPLLAYRLAASVNRPYAATASGADWAFVKAHDISDLVLHWTAYAYASGQIFMAPHRQWCHTDFLGTHWYDGPTDVYAPFFQFIRAHPQLFDEYETVAQVDLVFPYRSYALEGERWFEIGKALAATNISYRLLLAGDRIVDHPLERSELSRAERLLIPEEEGFESGDKSLLREFTAKLPVHHSVAELSQSISPIARVPDPNLVRTFPRAKPGSAVVHLLNRHYQAQQDRFAPISDLPVRLDLKALGVPEAKTCTVFSPSHEPLQLPIEDEVVVVPSLQLWSILSLSSNP